MRDLASWKIDNKIKGKNLIKGKDTVLLQGKNYTSSNKGFFPEYAYRAFKRSQNIHHRSTQRRETAMQGK